MSIFNIRKEILSLKQDNTCIGCSHYKTPCSAVSTVIIRTADYNDIDIFFFGQGAGKSEDININKKNIDREPFVGRAGKYFRDILKYIWDTGIRFNVAFSNNIRCHPVDIHGKDRSPTLEEIRKCSPYLIKDIFKLRPKCVVPVGKSASCTFFPEFENSTMGSIRNITRRLSFGILTSEFSTRSVITYHPSYLCRQYGSFKFSDKNNFDMKFIADIQLALGHSLF